MSTPGDVPGVSSAARRAPTSWQRMSGGKHLLVSSAAGLVAGAATALVRGWGTGMLVAWVVGAAVFLAWTWLSVWPLDAAGTALLAGREDPSRPIADLVLLLAALGSVLTVATVIFRPHNAGPLRLILGVAAVMASWLVLHTIFTLRYARMYYGGSPGGVDFGEAPPSFRDFAYLGFTVGMTFQVSDTTVTSSEIRTVLLRHALASFFFGAIIIGITINLLAGLGH